LKANISRLPFQQQTSIPAVVSPPDNILKRRRDGASPMGTCEESQFRAIRIVGQFSVGPDVSERALKIFMQADN